MNPRERVTFSIRDWRSEVLAANAHDVLDRAEVGAIKVYNAMPYAYAYEFSNGRRFHDCWGSYETPPR